MSFSNKKSQAWTYNSMDENKNPPFIASATLLLMLSTCSPTTLSCFGSSGLKRDVLLKNTKVQVFFFSIPYGRPKKKRTKLHQKNNKPCLEWIAAFYSLLGGDWSIHFGWQDPFRGSPHILVLAEAYNAWDGQPAIGNTCLEGPGWVWSGSQFLLKGQSIHGAIWKGNNPS